MAVARHTGVDDSCVAALQRRTVMKERRAFPLTSAEHVVANIQRFRAIGSTETVENWRISVGNRFSAPAECQDLPKSATPSAQ